MSDALYGPSKPLTPVGDLAVPGVDSVDFTEGCIVRMLGCDLLEVVFDHIDSDLRLAVWLTCRAFNALRPAAFETSVFAMYSSPAMLEWATSPAIDCPSPKNLLPTAASIVLKMMHDLGVVAFAGYASAIVQLMNHRDGDVRSHAGWTASSLLRRLCDLNPVALAKHAGFIVEMIKQKTCFVQVNTDAFRALDMLVCKLGDLQAHTQLSAVVAETLGDPDHGVRRDMLVVLDKLDHTAIGPHARVIVRVMLDETKDNSRLLSADSSNICTLVLRILCKLPSAALTEFAGIVIEMLRSPSRPVRHRAFQALAHIEHAVLTEHMAVIVDILSRKSRCYIDIEDVIDRIDFKVKHQLKFGSSAYERPISRNQSIAARLRCIAKQVADTRMSM